MKPTCLLLVALFFLSEGTLRAGEPESAKALVPLALPVDCATCLSYNYVDLEYGAIDFGTPYFSDGDYHGLGFSKSLGSTFYLTGGYAEGGYDLNTNLKIAKFETERYRLGLGAHRRIAECIDLTLEGGVEHVDVTQPGCHCLDHDSWAYYVGPGIRARAGRFEMFAKALYISREGDLSQRYLGYLTPAALGIDEDGWVFSPGIIYHVTEHVGLKVAAEIGELDTAFLAGVRIEF